MKKVIKKSNRGLTFSFEGKNTKFNINDRYNYIIDPKSNTIYIVSSKDEERSLKVSRKRVGSVYKSLIDIRAKAIKDSLKDADLLSIYFKEDKIIIKGLKEKCSSKITKKVISRNSKKISYALIAKRYKAIKEVAITNSFLDNVVGSSNYYSVSQVISEINDYYSEDERKEIESGLNKTIKTLSLFSGAGMFDYPLHIDPDFSIVKAVEIDKAASRTYKENIGDIVENIDIREFDYEGEEIDLLWGGTSCKPFAQSNRIKQFKNHDDFDLIYEYKRNLKKTAAKVFVMENVAQAFSYNNGKIVEEFKEEFPEYDIKTVVLQDCLCGGYTLRKRAFMIGSRIGKVAIKLFKKVAKTVGDALKKVNKNWFNYNDFTLPREETRKRMSLIKPGENWSSLPKEYWKPSYSLKRTHSNTLRRLELDKPSVTIANFRKSNIIHPVYNRGISVAEASAISGFDERFKFLGSLSERQQQIANGVPFFMGVTVKNIVKEIFYKSIYGQTICVL